MATATQPFHFSPIWLGLHSHFISPPYRRGYIAISVFAKTEGICVAISLLPNLAGVTQPFHFSLIKPGIHCDFISP